MMPLPTHAQGILIIPLLRGEGDKVLPGGFSNTAKPDVAHPIPGAISHLIPTETDWKNTPSLWLQEK